MKWFRNSVSGVQNAKNTLPKHVRQIDANFPTAFAKIQNRELTNQKPCFEHWPMRSIDQWEALTNEKHEITLTGQRCVNYFIRCKYYNLIKINIINLTVTLENKIKNFKI